MEETAVPEVPTCQANPATGKQPAASVRVRPGARLPWLGKPWIASTSSSPASKTNSSGSSKMSFPTDAWLVGEPLPPAAIGLGAVGAFFSPVAPLVSRILSSLAFGGIFPLPFPSCETWGNSGSFETFILPLNRAERGNSQGISARESKPHKPCIPKTNPSKAHGEADAHRSAQLPSETASTSRDFAHQRLYPRRNVARVNRATSCCFKQ